MAIARQGVLRIIGAGALLLLLGFGIHRLGMNIFGVQECRFSVTPLLAHCVHQSIIASVERARVLNAARLKATFDALYPDIDCVGVARFATHIADISVEVFPPIAQINNEYVLTRSGAIVAKSYFNPRCTTNLPRITIADVNSLSPASKAWLMRWVESIAPAYRIAWEHDHEIYLHDKKNEGIALLCTVDTAFDAELEKRIAYIHTQITQKKEIESRSLGWTADIRFEKQIILCGAKGGGKHG